MSEPQKLTQEEIRLQEDRERKAYWRRWGCYLIEEIKRLTKLTALFS